MPRGKKQEVVTTDEKKTKSKTKKTKEPDTVNEEEIKNLVDETLNVQQTDNKIPDDNHDNDNTDSESNVIDDNSDTDDNNSDWGEYTDVTPDTKTNKQNTRIERGSGHTNTRVNILKHEAPGKTYNKKDFVRRQPRPKQSSVLHFSFDESIDYAQNTKLCDASVDDILKYLIAKTHDKRALCNVFRNTLTGIHNETTLPETTYVHKPRRVNTMRGRGRQR